MALTFGKNNRSIAFNPTSAFPLDARSYFESYQLAAAAAASAEAASSTNTQYYYGQEIVVVENNIASFYIIQPDKTLSKVSGKVEVDTNVFEYINGKLNLYGFSQAVAGAQLTKDSSGKLSWIKPDTTTVEGLSTAVGNLQKDLDENYYTKEETDIAIAAASHLKRKKVSSVDDIDLTAADADQYIYMVPSGLEAEDNKYYEYIVIITDIVDSEGILISQDKKIEKVGSWEVNLKDYATKQHVETNYVKIVPGKSLVDNAQIQKLLNLSIDAEPNVIDSVSDSFSITNEKLELVSVPTYIDLASNVSLINAFIKKDKDRDLVLKTEIEKLLTVKENAEQNVINSVDENEFSVTNDVERKLSIKAIEGRKITNLKDNSEFVEVVADIQTINDNLGSMDTEVSTVKLQLATINTSLTTMNTTVTNLANRLSGIEEAITWQEL